MSKIYAAYGSNLNLKQMAHRCPSAERIETGKLEGYELMFKGQADHAYATVERNPDSSTDVLLWKIDPQDEYFLDRYEGYPDFYTKETVKVKMPDGRELDSMMYVMNPKFKAGLPTHSYFMTVLEGYIDNDLDTDALMRALAKASVQMQEQEESLPMTMEM